MFLLSTASKKPVLVVLGYASLFLLFDRLAVLFEVAPGVSLWYPSAGLNLALLVCFGLRYTPLVFLATLASGLFIAQPALPLDVILVPALLVAAGNAGAGWWLRRRLPRLDLESIRAVGYFVLTALVLPALISLLAVIQYTLTDVPGYTWGSVLPTAFSWWTGDVVGLLTLTPLLLLGVRWQPRADRFKLARSIELIGQLVAIGAVLYLTLVWWNADNRPLYLCFLPLLWLVLRHGLPRAVLGVFLLNTGTMLLLAQHNLTNPTAAGEAQLYMIVLALTGLFLGALVSEQQRALRLLQQTYHDVENRLAEQGRTLDEPDLSEGYAVPSLSYYVSRLRNHGDYMAKAIRAQTQLNERLSASEQRLKTTQARKDQFFSIASHDLKNMLTATLGFLALLKEDANTMPRSMMKEFAVQAHRSTTHMQALLDNLLSWAQMQASRAESAAKQRVDLYEVIRNKVDALQPDATRKQIRLENRVPSPTPAYGDAAMIGSVVQNLLSNAIKFTPPEGCVTLTAKHDGDSVRICVTDSGVGIPQERIEQLFDPEAQVSTPGTAGEIGTGLGLHLCKKIIADHGGHLEVESQLGEGSSFSFTLPAHAPGRPVPPARLSQPAHPA